MVLVIFGVVSLLSFPAIGFWSVALGFYCTENRLPVREWVIVGLFAFLLLAHSGLEVLVVKTFGQIVAFPH